MTLAPKDKYTLRPTESYSTMKMDIPERFAWIMQEIFSTNSQLQNLGVEAISVLQQVNYRLVPIQKTLKLPSFQREEEEVMKSVPTLLIKVQTKLMVVSVMHWCLRHV